MKALAFFLLLTFVGYSQVETDKVAHFGVGYVVGVSTSAVFIKQKPIVSFSIGFGTGVLIGAAKEFYDSRGHGTPSFKHALWTGIGA